MKTILIIAALAATQEIDHTKDSLDTVKAALAKNEAVMIDVREKGEWNQGHLEGALFVPLSWLKTESKGEQFNEHVGEKVPAKKIVYIHCRSGGRALTAAGLLKKAGYDVRPMKQGFDELREAGFPAAK